jgi:hypothetical protein
MTAIDPASDQPLTGGPQAGWYHDPAVQDGTRLRWWDGASWSEHTRLIAQAAALPAPPVQAPFASTTAALPAALGAHAGGAAVPRRALHNGTAWWSFGLGVIALSIASLVILGRHSSIWISSSGAVAVLSGIRALRLRSLGFADALVPAVLGIAFGGLGTLIMLGAFLLA